MDLTGGEQYVESEQTLDFGRLINFSQKENSGEKCRIIIVALGAVALLSLAVYATKGPCVGGGSESFGPRETVEFGTKTVVSGTIYKEGVAVILGGDFVIFGKTGGFVDIPKRFPTI